MSSLKLSDEHTSPPATPGSRGVHVASSHFSKIDQREQREQGVSVTEEKAHGVREKGGDKEPSHIIRFLPDVRMSLFFLLSRSERKGHTNHWQKSDNVRRLKNVESGDNRADPPPIVYRFLLAGANKRRLHFARTVIGMLINSAASRGPFHFRQPPIYSRLLHRAVSLSCNKLIDRSVDDIVD